MNDIDLVADLRDTARSLIARDFTGPDPYDGLGTGHKPSRNGLVRLSRQIRVQAIKRSPVNLRPLFGIRPLKMTKTIAQCAIAGVRAGDLVPELQELVPGLIDELHARAQMQDGQVWWGYEFDTQMRWGFNPAGSPNLIVTRFAVDALLEADAAGYPVKPELLAGVGKLLASLEDRDDDGPYLRYVSSAGVAIHNASALGAGLAVRLGNRLNCAPSIELGARVGACVAQRLRPDGTWPYGASDSLSWVDSFHSAFTLIGLREVGIELEVAAEALRSRGVGVAGSHYYLDGRKSGDAHTLGTLLWWFTLDSCFQMDQMYRRDRSRLVSEDETGMRWGRGYPRWDESHVLRGLAEAIGSKGNHPSAP